MRLLAEITLTDEALVPWSPPRTFLGGKPGGSRWHVHEKDKRLIAFQDQIRLVVKEVYLEPPYTGPVMLCIKFTKANPDPATWGQRWWTSGPKRGHGDLTNLVKSTEDAIKTWRQWKMQWLGAMDGKKKVKDRVLVREELGVIEEDSQVCEGYQRKRWGEKDGLEIRVYAIEG